MEEEETRIQGVPLGRRLYALFDNKRWKIIWQSMENSDMIVEG